MMVFSRRLKRLRKEMEKNKIDVCLFFSCEPIDDPNIYYFTGFEQEKYHSFSCFLVDKEKTTLILSSLDFNRSKGNEADEIIEKKEKLSAILSKKINKDDVVGVDERIFPLRISKKIKKTFDISEIVSRLRTIKDEFEIDKIKKACKITNKGIEFIKENLRKGITEKKMALSLERELIHNGAQGMSFPTIVTSSKKSSHIHPFPSFSDNKISRGLGLIDFGVRYDGYCSDVTVPFSIGSLNKTEEKIVNTVKDAYIFSLKKLKNGVLARNLFLSAEKLIKDRGFELKHGLGHGFGLEVHDYPSISPRGNVRIKKNMTFTIEPGVYVDGVGGSRIENDFLMRGKKFDILTKSRFLKI